MGGKWEVLAWLYDKDRGEFADRQVYFGNSFIKMLLAIYEAKVNLNSGCITLRIR